MVKKGSGKQTAASATSLVRRRKPTPKQAKKLAKSETLDRAILPGSFRLSVEVFGILRRYWKPLGGVILVYLILNVFFASGVSSLNSTVDSIKADLNNVGAHAHPLLAGATGFLVLVVSAGSSSTGTGSALQAILIILESLAIIWSLRQLLAGKTMRIKQAYYSAAAPLIPFLIVGLVIFIQLLPITFGSSLLAAIASTFSTLSTAWSFLFGIVFVLLAAWSFYMISSTIFALYIVTLPNMHPRQALRSAKNLVRFRRWAIIRRILFLPLLLLVMTAAIIIPLILYATYLVAPVFYVLSALALLFAHTYLYSLYRRLLG